jgi:hypothetical protein
MTAVVGFIAHVFFPPTPELGEEYITQLRVKDHRNREANPGERGFDRSENPDEK